MHVRSSKCSGRREVRLCYCINHLLTKYYRARYQRQDCDLPLQIQDIARKVDRIVMGKITFIDSVGNPLPIPLELCRSYEVLNIDFSSHPSLIFVLVIHEDHSRVLRPSETSRTSICQGQSVSAHARKGSKYYRPSSMGLCINSGWDGRDEYTGGLLRKWEGMSEM